MDVLDMDGSVVADYEVFARVLRSIEAEDWKVRIDAIYGGRRL
jgi:hypothetical protein